MKSILACFLLLASLQYVAAKLPPIDKSKLCPDTPQYSLCMISALTSKHLTISKNAEITDVCLMIPESLDDLDYCNEKYGKECEDGLPADVKLQMLNIRERHRRCTSPDDTSCDTKGYVTCLRNITQTYGHPSEGLANTLASPSTCSKVTDMSTEVSQCHVHHVSMCKDLDTALTSYNIVDIRQEITQFTEKCGDIVCNVNYAACLQGPIQEAFRKSNGHTDTETLCPYAATLGNAVYRCKSQYSPVCPGNDTTEIRQLIEYVNVLVDKCVLHLSDQKTSASVPLRSSAGVFFVLLCIGYIWMI